MTALQAVLVVLIYFGLMFAFVVGMLYLARLGS